MMILASPKFEYIYVDQNMQIKTFVGQDIQLKPIDVWTIYNIKNTSYTKKHHEPTRVE